MKKNSTLTLFLVLVTALVLIGFIFIYSSSSVYALEKQGKAHYYVQKQFIGLIIGCIGLLVCSRIPPRLLQQNAPFIFFAALILTSLTLVPCLCTAVNGSRRWFFLGGFMVQPSEILKVAFIPYIAFFFTKHHHRLHSFIRGYVPLLCIMGITSLILIKQPDFGQAFTLSSATLLMLFIASFSFRYLLVTVLSLIPVTALIIYLKPYRFKRILTFLNPWDDRQGAGFQIIQSLIAIGSGGLFGVGIGNSRQKYFYLPMQHTDFIFSIIAEETGFLGAFTIITLYGLLLYVGFKLALQAKSIFSMFTISGFSILISLQALINIGVSTGLLPTKGIGLPFISYGNASLISSLCMVGFIIGCARERSL